MDQLLVNKRMAEKTNKAIKAARKKSLKMYGRVKKPIVKNKPGKFAECVTEQHAKARRPVIKVTATKQELIQKVREAGLTGMSGSNFPVDRKLEVFDQSEAAEKILLINGAECEPGLVHDQWLIYEYFEEICAGISLIAGAFGISRKFLAAKDFFLHTVADLEAKITLYKLPVRYPIGEEHVLIRQVLGIDLPNDSIPADNGILLLNVQTVLAIYRLFRGESIDGKYVTIADLDAARAEAVYVKYGENIQDKLTEYFGQGHSFYAGHGSFAAHELQEDEVFSGEVSFACVATEVAHNSNENKCKGCGGCRRICPQGVNVKEIVRRKEKDGNADISDLGIEKCIHCNSCTYVCKAAKNIAEYLQ